MSEITRHDYAPGRVHPHVMVIGIVGLLTLLCGAFGFAYARLFAVSPDIAAVAGSLSLDPRTEDDRKALSYLFPYYAAEFALGSVVEIHGLFRFDGHAVPVEWDASATAFGNDGRALFTLHGVKAGAVRYVLLAEHLPELDPERHTATKMRFSDVKDFWIALDPARSDDPYGSVFVGEDPASVSDTPSLAAAFARLAPSDDSPGQTGILAPPAATTFTRRIAETIAVRDEDGDGLVEILELLCGTDPDDADSDGDGFPDGEEVHNGYDPLGDGPLGNRCAIVE